MRRHVCGRNSNPYRYFPKKIYVKEFHIHSPVKKQQKSNVKFFCKKEKCFTTMTNMTRIQKLLTSSFLLNLSNIVKPSLDKLF